MRVKPILWKEWHGKIETKRHNMIGRYIRKISDISSTELCKHISEVLVKPQLCKRSRYTYAYEFSWNASAYVTAIYSYCIHAHRNYAFSCYKPPIKQLYRTKLMALRVSIGHIWYSLKLDIEKQLIHVEAAFNIAVKITILSAWTLSQIRNALVPFYHFGPV